MSNSNICKIQVFRDISPIVGRHYQTAFYTEKININKSPYSIYYTTNPLRYLGKYVRSITTGYRDAVQHKEYYNNNGVEIELEYDYDGKTCLLEIKIDDV